MMNRQRPYGFVRTFQNLLTKVLEANYNDPLRGFVDNRATVQSIYDDLVVTPEWNNSEVQVAQIKFQENLVKDFTSPQDKVGCLVTFCIQTFAVTQDAQKHLSTLLVAIPTLIHVLNQINEPS